MNDFGKNAYGPENKNLENYEAITKCASDASKKLQAPGAIHNDTSAEGNDVTRRYYFINATNNRSEGLLHSVCFVWMLQETVAIT
ncbi:unnamed protein product [Pieris brassicae]|uniref:Uncharacterized protein n=1 Tax=Pieris brassicae TaxID=7116 RepID=A0A9P0TYS9_PIEBR|nr:unnamed protein product [Pieris brassicae]